MLITNKIWRILAATPDSHPTDLGFWGLRPTKGDLELFTCGWFLRGLVIVTSLTILLISAPVMQALLLPFLLAVPALLLIFHSTFLGIYWATRTAKALATARHSQRDALLGVSPSGQIGMSWKLAAICFHRGDLLLSANRLVRRILSMILVIVTALLILLSLRLAIAPQSFGAMLLIADFIGILGIAIAAGLDHQQSIAIAALVGILTPTQVSRSDVVQVITASLFITFQLIIYVIMLGVLRFLEWSSFHYVEQVVIQKLFIVLPALLSFYLLREALITLLWRLLLNQYDFSPKEFEEILTT